LKERFVTLGLALGSLALFYVLFVPKPAPTDNEPALPLSTELRPNGYQAAWRWLKSERVPVAALHDRYDRLFGGNAASSPSGNILLTTLPHKLPVRPNEAEQLDRWVERGNTLIVLAALDDTPLWSLMNGARLVDAVGRLTRLKFTVIGTEGEAQAEGEPQREPQKELPTTAAPKTTDRHRAIGSVLKSLVRSQSSLIEPRGEHPLLQEVKAVQVLSEFPASRWRAAPMDRSGVLQIGQIAGSGDAAIWLRRQGDGQVITFAVASIFSNEAIGERDNARLLSNLIAWSRGPDGTVIFDDAHQGVVSYYDAKAFFKDPRLHRTLAWIVLLWFVFVLGVQRLRARIMDWNPVDVTAFIAGSGEFFAATLTPAAAGARLLVNFFNSIRSRLGSAQDGTPDWEWLSRQAGVSAHDLSELQRLYARAQAGRRIDLVRLQNLLVQLQGNIL
jgi:Domain of unknown function (DUF4350)